jgi:hypothetical protein
MTVRLSIWRAERTSTYTFKLWRGNAIAGYVVTRRGTDGPAWYARPMVAGRKGSRIGRPSAAAAARAYFGGNAAAAIEAVIGWPA